MARKERDNKAREKDHKQIAAEKKETDRKILELNMQGKNHWCENREQQIAPAVCEKVQSSAGCPNTDCPVWEAELNGKATKKPRTNKKGGPTKSSYQTIMSAYFFENGVATLDQLVKAINSDPTRKDVERIADHKNVSVGISILKNATRVKNPLRIEYSRITKLYYFLDHEAAAEQYKTDLARIEEEKKAKRKAAAEAKKAEKATGDKKAEKKKPAPKKKNTKKAEGKK